MNRRFTFFSLLFIPFLFPGPARAQHAFQAILPGLTPAYKRPIVQTADGGFCILAQSWDEAVDEDDADYGWRRYHNALVKIGPDGTVEWGRQYVRPNVDENPQALCIMPDGGFLVVGACFREESTETDEEGNLIAFYNYRSVVAMRLNAHGYPLWTRTYRWEEGDIAPADVAVLEDGSAVITGALQKTDTLNITIEPELYTENRWKALAFKINPDGEVLWERALIDFPAPSMFEQVDVSFATAVCPREENAVTLAVAMQHRIPGWSSLLLTLTDRGNVRGEGTWLRTWREEPAMRGNKSAEDYSTFINDLAALPDGGCALAGLTGESWGVPNAGLTALLDRNDSLLRHRVYVNHHHNSPFTASILPFGEEGFLLAGRTPLIWSYDGINGYDSKIDDPVIVLTDGTGALREAKRFITRFEEFLPIPEDSFGTAGSFFQQPHFAVTDDGGLISVGDIETKGAYGIGGMFMVRFTPDITTCGRESVQSLEVMSDSILEPTRSEDVVGDGHLWREHPPVDAFFSGNFLPPLPPPGLCETKPVKTEGREQEKITSPIIEALMTSDVIPQEDDTLLLVPRDTASRLTPEQVLHPVISRVNITLEEPIITSRNEGNVTVKEMEITPRFLCGEQSTAGTSSSDRPAAISVDADAASEYLRLRPNSVPKGTGTVVEFGLAGREKPTIELISAGLGQTMQRLTEKEILWNGTTGSATLGTDGLPTGVYLVRLRSGEKQLTAKLEVR